MDAANHANIRRLRQCSQRLPGDSRTVV